MKVNDIKRFLQVEKSKRISSECLSEVLQKQDAFMRDLLTCAAKSAEMRKSATIRTEDLPDSEDVKVEAGKIIPAS